LASALSDQSLSRKYCGLLVSVLPALSTYLSPSSKRAVKHTVKYAPDITTSPQPSADAFSLQDLSLHHTADNDPDHEGYHSPSHPAPIPPRSATDPQHRGGRHTSAQSFRRRMTFGGWGAKQERPLETNEKNVSKISLAQTVRKKVSSLFVPEHRVGKAPGIWRELRTIIFGSCASGRSICF
jgi:hypothetical protein